MQQFSLAALRNNITNHAKPLLESQITKVARKKAEVASQLQAYLQDFPFPSLSSQDIDINALRAIEFELNVMLNDLRWSHTRLHNALNYCTKLIDTLYKDNSFILGAHLQNIDPSLKPTVQLSFIIRY